MTLREYHCDQGSEEWLDLRRGIVTASNVGNLLVRESPDPTTIPCPNCKVDAGPCISLTTKQPTPIKTIHQSRRDIADDMPKVITAANNDTSRRFTLTLLAERITGETEPAYVSDDMLRGQLEEANARDHYAAHHTDKPVTETGFFIEDRWGFPIGYSPDGLVGDDGLLEVKSPRAKEHLRTWLADEVPDQYMPQLQAGLLVTGRQWIDYASHYAGQPLYVKRVYPDPAWQAAIVDAVAAFEQRAVELTDNYLRAVDGLVPTERRYDLATLYQDVI